MKRPQQSVARGTSATSETQAIECGDLPTHFNMSEPNPEISWNNLQDSSRHNQF